MNKVLLYFVVVTSCLVGNITRAEEKAPQDIPPQTKQTSVGKYARLRSVDIGDMHWTDGFWAEKFELCHNVMIPNMWRLLEDVEISHAYDNFLIAAGLKEGSHHGPKWHDGDFYKWLEATAYAYGLTKDEKLDKQMDEIIEVIGKAHIITGGDWGEQLYRPLTNQQPKDIDIRLIPYYAWGNRGQSEMTVWLTLR